MATVDEKNIGRMAAIRLGPGEDLLAGIVHACRTYDIKDAIILSCIGSLEYVHVYNSVPLSVIGEEIIYGYAPEAQTWGGLQGVMEMCSAKGIIHLSKTGKVTGDIFITFSNAAGTVLGGRLGEGTLVKLTAEIIIGELV